MSEFNYLKANRVYNELYYQYPKVFIESDTYKDLSEGAKIAYMLLKARSELAIIKNQIDEQGNLYFEFTGKELATMMNCSERRITSIKKELEEFCLLKQVPMGFNKTTGKNEKNRLYLAELEVSNQDVYLMQKRENYAQSLDNSGLAKFATQSEEAKTSESLDNSGLANFATQSKNSQSLDNSGLAKFAKELNNSLDTNRHNIDTEKDHLQDQLLLDNFETIMKDNSIATFVPERVLSLIKTFSSSYSEAQKTVQTIHNAKAKAEKDAQTKIIFEDLDIYGLNAEQELYQTLLKAYQKQKTEKVENIQNLIFVYVKNWFMENPIAAKQQAESSEELPKVPLHDWLNEG
ncbi:putative replication protein repa [Enterococcus mundtii 1A]|uniref:replication initiator protein A n=1 Tax=Enterococcus mundtii TaxID=53346 RepID=UPI00230314B4|nr:replication initiator protein A [Enterococcus mundtii]MDA9428867.1 putative replication protein repa [Enterococcus mundtii 1A]